MDGGCNEHVHFTAVSHTLWRTTLTDLTEATEACRYLLEREKNNLWQQEKAASFVFFSNFITLRAVFRNQTLNYPDFLYYRVTHLFKGKLYRQALFYEPFFSYTSNHVECLPARSAIFIYAS